ncbi:MAG: HlyD family efflux transporter periplasmic adaptor subunit [Chloroflexi bacterium]|nr:HlyD family efflux transporter periplasmic adaptor subunit [Chloroflexota bacterium]
MASVTAPTPTQPPPPSVPVVPPLPPARQRRRAWRPSRRVLLIGSALLLIVLVVIAIAAQRSASNTAPAPTPAAAPLVAHGQIVPVRVARVGTQGGGVVQQLATNPGDSVQAQTPLAWVVSSSGTEIVTAPFAGSVANVLVHAGDTLAPGAAVAVVADMRTLQIETNDVDEFLINKVSIGETVTATIDALDDYAVNATVTNISLLPQTTATGAPQYPVILRLGALPPGARAGMSVRVTFPG